MKKLVLISCLLFSIFSCGSKQSDIRDADCQNYLGYDIVRIVEKPIWLPDSIDVEFMGRKGFLVIKDCRGNADLVLYDEKGNKILEGKFKESDIFETREISNETTIKVNIPVIDGEWYFKNFTASRPLPVSDL